MVHVFVLVYIILNMIHAFYLSYYTSRLSYLLKFEGMVTSWSAQFATFAFSVLVSHSRRLRTQEFPEWSRPTSDGGEAATFLINFSSVMLGIFLVLLIT
jgi:hypothetical protein